MLGERMEAALNGQVNAELYSSYLYLAMAAYFNSINLPGFVNWFKVQALEELYHGMKIYGFIEERGGRASLAEIKAPPAEWGSPLEAVEAVAAHERKVTGLINDLVNLAVGEKDHATETFLDWFVTEQVEEESAASTIVDQLKLVGDHGVALFMLDGQLGQRVFTPPAEAGP